MLVSFCVIAYNEEQNIEKLFFDICNQDYPHQDMEIILVDSMSTDKTKILMQKFAEKTEGFRRIVVKSNIKKKQAAGWNTAICEARGNIIMRIDAHTMIPKDFVSKNIKCIEAGEDVTGGPRPNIAEEDTSWKQTLLLAESSMFGSSIAPYRNSHHKTYVKSVFHGAYRREVFEKAGLFNENLGRTEDNEMHYRIRQAGYKICYDPQIISYQHTRSTWKGMIKQKFGNGYWIGLTLGVCPKCFSIYHFVPLCFIIVLLLTLILYFVGIKIPFIFLMVLYCIVNLIMSVIAIIGKKKNLKYICLPFIFLSLHLSYGIGTLIGIIKMPFWKKTIKNTKKADEHKNV
ncbi:glycosyltransferase family 2 protein [Ruminococcus sp. AF18-22]|nr:glycosyltransferase family 2 protein [Ruminococcus sp. AF18-22]